MLNAPAPPALFYAENKVPSVTYSVIDSEHNKLRLSFEVAHGERLKIYTMSEEDYMQFADPSEFETGVNSEGLLVENSFNDVIYSPTGETVDFYVENSTTNPYRPYYGLVFDGILSPASWEVPYNEPYLIKLVPEDQFGTGIHNGVYYNQYAKEPVFEKFVKDELRKFKL